MVFIKEEREGDTEEEVVPNEMVCVCKRLKLLYIGGFLMEIEGSM